MNEGVFKKLSEIKPRKVDWLWEPLIPYEMITILEGDPGTGKSFIAMHLASEITRGGTLPDGTKLQPGNVLYISAEDDPQYTTRPRIDAMGGDPERIHVLTGFLDFSDEGLETVEAELDKLEPELIIVDPWVSFVPSKIKVNDSNAIRQILTKLNILATEYGCAVLMIRHLVKSKHENALYQGGGTMDVIAVARSALRVGDHPEQPDMKVMAHLKHNVGPPGSSWQYRLEASGVLGEVPKLKFVGETDVTADQLNRPQSDNREAPRATAEQFLEDFLKNGRRLAKDVQTAAKQAGIAPRTLDRAKRELGVRSQQNKKQWYWYLP